ncbi:MAG: hypothetical protein KY464_05605 [Gemmatimonadetes bacterium]|nr:hypothetical protein [Gemmatimonadota bacterium]
MKLYITYDLKPGNEYPRLVAALRAMGGCQPLQGGWVVDVQFTAAQVRDHLRKFIQEDDRLLILSLGGSWASIGLSADDAGCLRRKVSN